MEAYFMAAGNSVNDEIREQHQKLKDRPFKEKLSYFIDYYKVHVIVTILVLLLGGNLIYTIVTQKDIALYTICINSLPSNNIDTYISEFETFAEINTEDFEVNIEPAFSLDLDGGDMYSIANVQKMIAMISAMELDSVFTDQELLEYYGKEASYADLSTILPEEILEEYSDSLYYMDVPDDGKGEIPIGIDVSSSAKLQEMNLYPGVSPVYYAIVSNSQRTDTAVEFLNYLFQ